MRTVPIGPNVDRDRDQEQVRTARIRLARNDDRRTEREVGIADERPAHRVALEVGEVVIENDRERLQLPRGGHGEWARRHTPHLESLHGKYRLERTRGPL